MIEVIAVISTLWCVWLTKQQNILKKQAAEKLFDYHLIIDNKFKKLYEILNENGL